MNYQDQSSLRIIIFQRKRQSIALSVDCRGRWMSNTRTWLWSRGDSLLKHCRIVCFWLHTRLHWKWQKLHRHVWERVFSIFRRQSLVCVTHLYKLRKFMYRTVRRLLKHKTPILSTNNYKNYSKKQVLLLYVWPCFIRIGSIPLRSSSEKLETVKDSCFRNRSEFEFAHCVMQNAFDFNKN